VQRHQSKKKNPKKKKIPQGLSVQGKKDPKRRERRNRKGATTLKGRQEKQKMPKGPEKEIP